VKVYIDCDERYPDWSISADPKFGSEVEVTEDQFAAIKAAEVEYSKWQLFLRDALKSSGARQW